MRTHRTALELGVLSLLAACTGQTPTASVDWMRSTPLRPTIIDPSSREVPKRHIDLVAEAEARLPPSLPADALSLAATIEDAVEGKDWPTVSRGPNDTTLATRVFVSLVAGRPTDLVLACVVDGQGVPCSGASKAWAGHVAPGEMIVAPIKLSVESGSRVDILVLIAEDARRAFPASSVLTFRADGPPRSLVGNIRPTSYQTEILRGCDHAAFVRGTGTLTSYTPPRSLSRGEELFITTRRCGSARGPIGLLPIMSEADRLAFGNGSIFKPTVEGTVTEPVPNSPRFRSAPLQYLAYDPNGTWSSLSLPVRFAGGPAEQA